MQGMETTNNAGAIHGPFEMPKAGQSYIVGFADPKTGRRKAGASYLRIAIASVTEDAITGHRINVGNGRKTVAADLHTMHRYTPAQFAKMLANGAAIDFTVWSNAQAEEKKVAKAAKKAADKVAAAAAALASEHAHLTRWIPVFEGYIVRDTEAVAEARTDADKAAIEKWIANSTASLDNYRKRLAKLLAKHPELN